MAGMLRSAQARNERSVEVVRDLEQELSDLRARLARAEAERDAGRRLADAVESLPKGFALFDADDRLVLCNRRYAETLFAGREDLPRPGVPRARLLAHLARGARPEAPGDSARGQPARRRGPGRRFERTLADGRCFLVTECRTGGGGTVAVSREVTEAKATEAALRAGERRLRTLVENMRGLIYCHGVAGDGPHGYDEDGARVYGADAVRLAGTVDERGRARIGTWYEAVHPEDRPAYLAAEARRKATHEPYALEYRITHPATGEPRWMREVAWAVEDPDAGCTYLDSYILDVTEQKVAEARIRHLALHDPLTGLPNRALFHDRLGQALARAERLGGRVALLLLDLDRFKEVNDAFGHDAGDALLREVAGRLARRLRGCDTAARLGGDEFGVILPGVSGAGAAAGVAGAIAAAMAEPVSYGGGWVSVGASVGAALFPDDGVISAELLKNADLALYAAKARGGGGHVLFEPGLRVRPTRKSYLGAPRQRASRAGARCPSQRS